MLDGRIVEALLEIIERGFYILSVARAWGCHVDALGTTRAVTLKGPSVRLLLERSVAMKPPGQLSSGIQ